MKTRRCLKLGLLVVLSVLSLSAAFSIDPHEKYLMNLSEDGFNGNIKKVTIKQYSVRYYYNGDQTRDSREDAGYNIVQYNQDGSRLLEDSFNPDGSLFNETRYIYDAKSLLYKIESYDEKNSLQSTVFVVYEKNKIKFQADEEKDTDAFRTVFLTDNMQLKEMNIVYEKDEQRLVYRYNDEGLLIEKETIYRQNGKINRWKNVNFYEGKILSKTQLISDNGLVDDEWEYKYDENGFLIEESGRHYKKLYLRDNNGNVIEERILSLNYLPPKQLISVIKYEYEYF